MERKGYGLEASCDFCNSSKIDKIEGKVIVMEDGRKNYRAKYRCMNCGASADVNEVWENNNRLI